MFRELYQGLFHVLRLKISQKLLEGIKDCSELGNPSKGFQLETNCFVSVFVCLFFALSILLPLGLHGRGLKS